MDYEILANNFQDGDVIYGLDSPRAIALATLKTRSINRTEQITTVFCCGLFSSAAIKRHIIIQNDITNSVWDPSSPNTYSSNKNIKRELVDGERGIAFKNFIQNHPKYNVASRYDPEVDPQKRAKNAWQRTSKCGLRFHAERGGTIHFILTNLKIDAVVSKVGYGESITSAELRWLYRHRNVQAVIDSVKFYEADKEVPYQDVFKNPAWENYTQTNTYDSQWGVLRVERMFNQVNSANV